MQRNQVLTRSTQKLKRSTMLATFRNRTNASVSSFILMSVARDNTNKIYNAAHVALGVGDALSQRRNRHKWKIRAAECSRICLFECSSKIQITVACFKSWPGCNGFHHGVAECSSV